MGKLAEILDKLAEKIEEIATTLFPEPVPVKVNSKPRPRRKNPKR